MAIHYNPTTVSDGLVLALDAANTRSYVGSGTTWTDVSYNGNNGTLTNGPAYTTVGFTEPFGGAGGVYFDGSGDYLTTANSTSDFSFGTGDFTIEFWINSTQTTRADPVGWNYNYGSAGWAGFIFDGSTGYVSWFENTNSRISATSTGWNNGSWNHVSVTRSGNSVRMFLNGSQVGSTYTTSFTYGAANSGFIIGTLQQSPSSGYLNGYISNLRIVKGTALYTSNFTPPRSLLPAVSGTSLLTCQKGSITDASSNNFAITVNGDARPVYGFPSFKFDGTNDYASIPDSDSFTFGSENFAIECWIYPNSTGSFPSFISKYAGSSTNSSFFFSLGDANQTLEFYLHNGVSGQQAIIQAGTVSLSSWNHIVATRIGNQITTYLNGSVAGTQSWSYSVYDANVAVTVGAGQYNGAYYWNGNISNVRIYKGKGLTAEEVQQNYNALKGRFGL